MEQAVNHKRRPLGRDGDPLSWYLRTSRVGVRCPFGLGLGGHVVRDTAVVLAYAAHRETFSRRRYSRRRETYPFSGLGPGCGESICIGGLHGGTSAGLHEGRTSID
jgi:hypothetical protein